MGRGGVSCEDLWLVGDVRTSRYSGRDFSVRLPDEMSAWQREQTVDDMVVGEKEEVTTEKVELARSAQGKGSEQSWEA